MEYINGNSAVVRGAVRAGCDFFAGYPITPATSILLELTRVLPPRGGVVIEAEDEIASCGLCIAAAMAGRRVMTATSGPGLSLSSESIGLAIMGEVPLVFIVSQRMGPATGGATTTSDGDVQFVRWGTSGGYPIVALAPWNLAGIYVLTQRAFALAAALRTPVFVMLSKELSMSMGTVDLASAPTIEVGPMAGRDAPSDGNGAYRPYELDRPDSIPAFAPIGGDVRVRFTTSIHDADGVITTDPAAIERKLSHLVAKIESRRNELELCVTDLQADAETLIVCYGVVAGAARQAVRMMRAKGRPVSLLIVESLWPVPERAIGDALASVKRIVVPEMNPGLYVREIERLAGDRDVVRINTLTGKLISPDRIVAEVDR